MSARDGYREYYAEKLWEWIPAIHRELDEAEGGKALRAFVEALASRAALLKRSHDRLWDDQSIELADDWAIPYIADLVATRLVSALNPRARRADVAKTIYYRRRKGTLAVLEQLIADMTGWDGKVVEEFRRLGRMRHGLDGTARSGRLTGTPEGGWADLRAVRGARLVGDAFDEFHYTPDMRRPAGAWGRRGIAKLTFHLHRLQSVEFRGVWPRAMKTLGPGEEGFTFDPSGRDVALFSANDAGRNGAAWRTADEWALPRPIGCRLLGETIFEIGEEEVAWILAAAPIPTLAQRRAAAVDLRKLAGQRFVGRAGLVRVLGGLPSAATLTTPGVLAGLLSRALIDACGAAALLPKAPEKAAFGPPSIEVRFEGGATQLRDRTRAANLGPWNDVGWTPPTASATDLYIDPERGRCVLALQGNAADRVRVRYRVGMAAPIGAGAYAREAEYAPIAATWQDGSSAAGVPVSGIAEVVDSATYVTPPNQLAVVDSTVFAREAQRPYVRLTRHWRFTADGDDRRLTLDGLWVGARPVGDIVLEGNFERVHLRDCTLDPGGIDAAGAILPVVELVITGFVEELVVERCIVGNIRLRGAAASVERMRLVDSIVHARLANTVAIALPRTALTMLRSTVIGPAIGALTVDVERLDASDSLIAGRVDATDTQNGCFRFSARGPGSRVPHPYESHVVAELGRLFASRVFGHHAYAQLSEAAPTALARGGEHGGEIGAFNVAMHPIKADSLRIKVDEYMPFGRLPNFKIEN
jgi:hypothetical protein